MTASLSGVFSTQQFTDSGLPAALYRLYTFAPGTTTQKVAYTDAAASVAHSYTSDGLGGLYIALNARGELPAGLFLTVGGYDLCLKTPAGVTVWTRRATGIAESADSLRTDLASTSDATLGTHLVGFKPNYMGSVGRLLNLKLQEWVSVTDFGGIVSSNDVAHEAANDAAVLAAFAVSETVYVPAGDFNVSATIRMSADGLRLIGAGQYATNIRYSGSAAAIHFGGTFPTLVYNNEVRDLSVFISSRASTTIGIKGTSCVYWNIENVSCFGSGSPNSGVPADQVLYGWGLYFTDNAIIGRVSHVSCRLWSIGYYLRTDPASQSRWVAAVEFCGHGELANNMRGIVVGDPAVALYCGVGCDFHNLSVQGNYTTGVNCNSGDKATFHKIYFEGNANYDIVFGDPSGAPSPIGCEVSSCPMNAEDIGTTAYGTFPYLAKVYVNRGVFTTVRDNNISISSGIPLVIVESASDTANITGNRLNSAAATTARITDNSTTTITRDNYPEKPRVSLGGLMRSLTDASGDVSYVGYSFRPTELEFSCSVTGGTVWCDGYAAAESGIQMICRSFTSASVFDNTGAACIKIVGPTSADVQSAVLKSVDADGFTLTWTKTGSPSAGTLQVYVRARRS